MWSFAFCFYCVVHHRDLHSFPTRRSSDLELLIVVVIIGILAAIAIPKFANTKGKAYIASMKSDLRNLDRKSTRLNSSHVANSYAVTCMNKDIACTPVAGQVSWCPTTGNNL